jgi:hypothetical protein
VSRDHGIGGPDQFGNQRDLGPRLEAGFTEICDGKKRYPKEAKAEEVAEKFLISGPWRGA